MSSNAKRWIVLIAGAALLLLFILPAQLLPSSFLPDDTYYYLQVAYNIVNGHGSTFNRIMPTNGYHPLWMLFCMGAMVLAGSDKGIALHIVLLIQALLFLGILSYFIRIAREVGLRYWGFGVPILAIYFLTGLYGSEAHINGLMTIIALHYLMLASAGERARNWVLAGIFMGLAVLARLDNVFLLAAIAFIGIPSVPRTARPAGRSLLRDIIAFLLPAIIIVAPYLIYNVVSFGHFVPISGAIKSSFPRVAFNVSRLGTLGEIVTVCGVIGLLLSIAVRGSHRVLLRSLGVAVLLQSAYIALFLEFGAGWSWYYVFGVINIAFVIVVVGDMIATRIEKRRPAVARWLAGSFIALALVAAMGRSWYKLFFPYPIGPQSNDYGEADPDLRHKLGTWMKEHLPAESGAIVEDGAGELGYYSDLRIVPLDGLIADYDYNDEILHLGAARYLAAHNVGYYVGGLFTDSVGVKHANVVAPLYRRIAGVLTLTRNDMLMTMQDGSLRDSVAVWRIDTPRETGSPNLQ
jgi:hypothetical protein